MCPLLHAEPPLPLGLWPTVLQRASTCQETRNTPLDTLHFLVKEKSDLFRRSSAADMNTSSAEDARKWKRAGGSGAPGKRKHRQRKAYQEDLQIHST